MPRKRPQVKAQCYRPLLEGVGDAIILADAATGRIEVTNKRAEQLSGRTSSEFGTLLYLDLFEEETRKHLAASAQLEQTARDVHFTVGELIRPNGSRCRVDIALSLIGIGRQRFVQIIMRDSTALLRGADTDLLIHRLQEQNAELHAAQQRLIETDRVRTEFLGMMSHELRTPVNILIGYAHMLLESVAAGDVLPPADRAGILRRMVAAGHTLSELVEDTLSVLRLDAKAVHLDIQPVALDNLFHELKGNDRLLRGPDAVEERWIVEPDVPEIRTDRRKLRQVITNLVGNARKFTEAGHIDIRATVAGSERIRITVSDTGCGISPEHLANIFELYRQASAGQAQDGWGIGLYIVRRYLEMLQGTVECTSTIGKGTTFTIELPCRVLPPEENPDPAATNGRAIGAPAA
jgi:PAS domain S-box-containing protein